MVLHGRSTLDRRGIPKQLSKGSISSVESDWQITDGRTERRQGAAWPQTGCYNILHCNLYPWVSRKYNHIVKSFGGVAGGKCQACRIPLIGTEYSVQRRSTQGGWLEISKLDEMSDVSQVSKSYFVLFILMRITWI
jgi:hypothetical protein